MFGTFLLLSSALLTAYLAWRAASVPALRRRLPPWGVAAAAAALWAVLAAARLLTHGSSGRGASLLSLAGMDWLAILFIATVCLLAVDLATLFGFLFRRHAPRWRGWALLAAAALSALAVVQGVRPPVVVRHQVVVPGLPAALDGTTVAALSDLHLGDQLGRPWLEARVAQVAALRPDLVVLLGDLFEGHGEPPPSELLPVLARIRAPLGAWAVPGNHERHGGAGEALLEKAGIAVLRDRWVQLRPGLVLAGVADGEAEGSFSRALAGRPPGALLLLSHSPHRASKAAGAAGEGLMLSGHTHGGQVWPFGWLVRLRSPWVGGMYRLGGLTLVVGRGTGTWGPRMRLWEPGEITLLTLRAGG